MTKTTKQKIEEAEHFGSKWLGDANEEAEHGHAEKAEILYKKSQYWLDRYNRLVGNT